MRFTNGTVSFGIRTLALDVALQIAFGYAMHLLEMCLCPPLGFPVFLKLELESGQSGFEHDHALEWSWDCR